MRIKTNYSIIEITKAFEVPEKNILIVINTNGNKIIIAPNVNEFNEKSLYDTLFVSNKLDVSYFKNLENRNKVFVEEDYYDSLDEKNKEYLDLKS